MISKATCGMSFLRRLLPKGQPSSHLRRAVGARSPRAVAPASTTLLSRPLGLGPGLLQWNGHGATFCAARWLSTKAPPPSESPVVMVEYFAEVGGKVTQRIKVKLSPGSFLNVVALKDKFGLSTVEEVLDNEAVLIPFDHTTGNSHSRFHVQEGGVIRVTGTRKEGGESRPPATPLCCVVWNCIVPSPTTTSAAAPEP